MHDASNRVWPHDAAALSREQERLAALTPPPWQPGGEPFLVGGCFLAFAPGEQGPGHAGDHGWAAATVVECPGLTTVASAVVPCVVGAAYARGQLARREGPALTEAVDALTIRPDVLLVDATGRDHPRGAGLALQLGAVLGIPTIGVTQRTLLAAGDEPGLERGDRAPLWLRGEVVGAWVRTQRNVRSLAVHAAWRVDVDTAVRVVLASTGKVRAPEPLRRARTIARKSRADARATGG
ncbi:MAG: endonuclease V [Acidimicrobiia bacterium]